MREVKWIKSKRQKDVVQRVPLTVKVSREFKAALPAYSKEVGESQGVILETHALQSNQELRRRTKEHAKTNQ